MTPIELSSVRLLCVAVSVDGYALFCGGETSSTPQTALDIVDAYDTSLTRTSQNPLSVARYRISATTIGDYALLGGGDTRSERTDVVDAYAINFF